MAHYLITRTDGDYTGYDALVVRAKGRKQALDLVTGGTDGNPFEGFTKDGSNAKVERLTDSRDHDNRVIVASFVGE